MKLNSDQYGTVLSLVLDELKKTIEVVDEALLLAQYKNGTQNDVERLRTESNRARASFNQLSRLAATQYPSADYSQHAAGSEDK